MIKYRSRGTPSTSPSQGVCWTSRPLTEGPGPTSSLGSLPTPRVACRCSPVGFDRQQANNSPDRQVCMASLRNVEDDELDPDYDNEQLVDILADEPTVDAPRMKTRSTEGSVAGGMWRIAPATQCTKGISTMLLQ
jgi:hypothetical protein